MKMRSTRKFASVLAIGALVLSGSVAVSNSAMAAGKQGTVCKTLKAKSGTYTCAVNPLAPTSKTYVWVTPDCVSTQAAYLSSVADLASYTKNATNTTNQAQSLLASYQNALTVAKASLDDVMNTKVYPIEYTPGTRTPSVTVIGFNAAIAAYQAKLANDQQRLAFYQAQLAKDTPGSSQAIGDQKSINDFQLGINSRTNTIALLNKQVARIQKTITDDQTAITQWTLTVNNSIAQQKSLLSQLKSSISGAQSARASACKKGL